MDITVQMTRAAYDKYRENWNQYDGKDFSNIGLAKYLNRTGGYLGRVTDVAVLEN